MQKLCIATSLVGLMVMVVMCTSSPRCHAASAPLRYEYTENCSKAYQLLLAMHFQEANAMLAREKQEHPDNLMPVYLADYEDCITLLLTGDRALYEQRIAHLDERLNRLAQGNAANPWHLYCQAGIYLHWGIIQVQMGDQVKAALKFRKAFALIAENKKLFPDFEYNNVYTGLRDALIGSLPGNFKWLASVFGLKGNLKEGTAQLATFINTHTSRQPMHAETILYYTFCRFYLTTEQADVWNFLNSPQFPTRNNLLATFVKAHIALDYRNAAAAIAVLQQAADEPDYASYPIFSYQAGNAYLSEGSPSAISSFRQYIATDKSGNYIKDSWQKLAWVWYIDGNMQQASNYRNRARTQGRTRADVDKQALKFAAGNTWPNRLLLQARLLADGGYYARALAMLHTVDTTALTDRNEITEYYYRTGQVQQETPSSTNAALTSYRQAINAGNKLSSQYAARAALQMGIIYEKLKLTKLAIASYRQCLDMPDHDFQNSIDQKANAGLARLTAN